jgi:hypothetical protein
MLLPAYVCDAFYPLLLAYNISPLFLDVEEKTYQPPVHAYTDELLDEADVVLLVATYGKEPDETVMTLLKDRQKVIIEDYAMRSPLLRDPIHGSARIYSLPKTLPVPDGGLAVLPKNIKIRTFQSRHFSLVFLKNALKLLPGVAPLIARLRDALNREQPSPSWSGMQTASALTKAILSDYCTRRPERPALPAYTYCHPMHTGDPARTVRKLMRHGISTERIWSRPIVANRDVCAHYSLDDAKFPKTHHIASGIVCAPLWYLKNRDDYQNYVATLDSFGEN